jgi:hypothetical protein
MSIVQIRIKLAKRVVMLAPFLPTRPNALFERRL